MIAETRFVGELAGTFVVPSYQRGYRWGPDEARLLLDDLASIDEKADEFYCLQPIVVMKLADGRYEVVDGQQRLTTLYLLYRFMKEAGYKKAAPQFELSYTTRLESESFLRSLEPSRAQEYIDFAHFYDVHKCIEKWFAERGNDAETVADEIFLHLRRRVKVIWYEIGDDIEPTALFTRLNIGRIPLNNAELLKALLLKRRKDDGATDKDVMRRQLEMGMAWDAIEHDLHDEALWAFVTNRPGRSIATRIELLFDLIAGSGGGSSYRTFYFFKKKIEEGASVQALWREVTSHHALLKDWFADRNLYHWIGFLVANAKDQSDNTLRALVAESKAMTKTAFTKSIHDKIVEKLNLSREEIGELHYQTSRKQCERVLLLFNVESTRLLRHSRERYPFTAHKAERWSLEHIHAQNAEDLRTKTQWQVWLREHRNSLVSLRLDGDQQKERDALVSRIDKVFDDVTKESFQPLADEIIALFDRFDDDDEPHGIDNLALLPRETNSELNNAVFEVKRQRILAIDRRGEYLPICTRRVFLKYFTAAGDQQLQLWSKQDRAAYYAAMFSETDGILTPYLRGDDT